MINSSASNLHSNSRFVIQEKLGSGGFGTVYKVYDQEKASIVALKVLHDKKPEELYYFKKEFRTLADLTHPNLVTLYELFSDGEECFFTMEMVEGNDFLQYAKKSLEKDVIKKIVPSSNDEITKANLPINYKNNRQDTVKVVKKPLKAQENFQTIDNSEAITLKKRESTKPNFDTLKIILKQLIIGIEAIHKAGKLHRDIKPSNILVTKQERVVILDFGIATEIFSQEQESRIVGTPVYMSPEQFKGVSLEASDWYSVGVVLYEALTGQLPFIGEFAELMREKQTKQVVAPRELNQDVPDDLNDLCQRLLQKDPKKRPSSQEILSILNIEDVLENNLQSSIPLEKIFIGREEYLQELLKAFQIASKGFSSIVYIEGRSGLGKTALVNHFLEKLKSDATSINILLGRCYAQETVPYKAFDSVVDSLSQYLKNIPNKELETLLPTEILALAKLFPVLKQVDSVLKAKKTSFEIPDAQEVRRQAFAALRKLLINLAKIKPIIVFIDDLHWGDLDSAILFGELFSVEPLPRILFIGSYRSKEENSPFLQKVLALDKIIQKYSQVFKITVKELSFSESLQLANSLFECNKPINLALAENIAKESGGSPLFIDELIRYRDTREELSSDKKTEQKTIDVSTDLANLKGLANLANLDKVIKARIEHMPDDAQRLLEVVAVAGQPINRNLARKIANLSDKELNIMALLRANRLIKVISAGIQEMIETYHDRIRETIIGYLPIEKLKNYHFQLAIELEVLKVDDVEQLLVHFKAAQEKEKTAKYALIAADRAFDALAFDRAAELYQIALETQTNPLEETKSLQIKFAEALTNAGRGREAAQAYLSALRMANQFEKIEFRQRASEQLLKAGHFDEGLELLRVVLKAVDLRIADNKFSALVTFLWLRLCVWFRGVNFIQLKTELLREEELLKINACFGAFLGLLRIDPIQAATFQARYLLLTLKSSDLVKIVRALCAESAYHSYSGGRNKKYTEKLVLKATLLAQQLNEPNALGLAGLSRLGAAFMQGDWEKCCNLSSDIEKIFRQKCKGVFWEISTMQVFVVRSLLMLGKFSEIVQMLPSIINEAKLRADLYTEINVYVRAGYLADLATTDDPMVVKEKIDASFNKWTQKEFHLQHYYIISGQIEILLYLGDSIAALELLEKYWSNFITFKRIQIIFIESHYLRARCRLAVAKVKSDAQWLLSSVEKDIREIEKEKMSYGNGWANLIRAGKASLQNNFDEVKKCLLFAEAEFKKSKMFVYQEISRWSYGLVINSEDGKELIKSVENNLAQQGIKKTERIREMYAPGKWQ